MREQLFKAIEKIKLDKNILSYDEQAVKQAIIMKLVSLLGWDIFNKDEVSTEYSLKGKRVDYSLRIDGANKLFLEVKNPREDLEKHQEQLLNYSFHEGVKLAILTNGLVWWFYLPLHEGNWESRRYYMIDIKAQESEESALRLIDFISRDNVESGKAVSTAEELKSSSVREHAIRNTLPKAWNKIITEKDELLLELLGETTERLCHYKPENTIIEEFLESNKGKLVLCAIPKNSFPSISENNKKPGYPRNELSQSYEIEDYEEVEIELSTSTDGINRTSIKKFHSTVFEYIKHNLAHNPKILYLIHDNTRGDGMREGRCFMKTYNLKGFSNLNFGFEPKKNYKSVFLFVHDNSPQPKQYSRIFTEIRKPEISSKLREKYDIEIRKDTGNLIKEERSFNWENLDLAKEIGQRLALFIEIVFPYIDK